jgi:cytochrome b involved in lipid metabolism
MKEVSAHNTPDDAWIVINDKVRSCGCTGAARFNRSPARCARRSGVTVVCGAPLTVHASSLSWCRGQVYDVSSWKAHPGGSVVFSHAGFDASGIFSAFHPASAYEMLEDFVIGTVSEPVADVDKDFRVLKTTVKQMGLHKARCVTRVSL